MKRTYVLFIVIQDHYKVKAVLKKLEEIGVPGATVMDSMGGMPSKSNKTLFSVVQNEATVLLAMDEVEKILGISEASKREGIMFTVPLVGQLGLL